MSSTEAVSFGNTSHTSPATQITIDTDTTAVSVDHSQGFSNAQVSISPGNHGSSLLVNQSSTGQIRLLERMSSDQALDLYMRGCPISPVQAHKNTLPRSLSEGPFASNPDGT